MIRIITATEPQAIKMTVDGRLAGEYVEVLDASVKEAMARGKPVRLFLRDVSGIDECARALLGRLATKGVHLSAAGVYNSYIVGEFSPTEPRD